MHGPKYRIGDVVKTGLTVGNPIADPGINVSLKGEGVLYVVGRRENNKGFQYTLSDLPVTEPKSLSPMDRDWLMYSTFAKIIAYKTEDELESTDLPVRILWPNVDEWFRGKVEVI